MSNILCVGELLIDFFGIAPGLGLAQQEQFKRLPGGAPANVAAVAAFMGSQTSLLSAVGRDGFGDFLVAYMHGFGVDTMAIERVDAPTTMAFVSVDAHGQRDFVFNRGADAMLSYSEVTESVIKGHKLVHFGAATGFLEGTLKETYIKALNLAKESGHLIGFDPNYRNAFWAGKEAAFVEALMPFIKAAHLVKVSDEELRLITGESSVAHGITKLIDLIDGVLCVTLGADGVLVASKAWQFSATAPSVNVVDTTGAGDAFVGALLHLLAAKENPMAALRDVEILIPIVTQAAKVASHICTEYGALTALQTLKDNF